MSAPLNEEQLAEIRHRVDAERRNAYDHATDARVDRRLLLAEVDRLRETKRGDDASLAEARKYLAAEWVQVSAERSLCTHCGTTTPQQPGPRVPHQHSATCPLTPPAAQTASAGKETWALCQHDDLRSRCPKCSTKPLRPWESVAISVPRELLEHALWRNHDASDGCTPCAALLAIRAKADAQ